MRNPRAVDLRQQQSGAAEGRPAGVHLVSSTATRLRRERVRLQVARPYLPTRQRDRAAVPRACHLHRPHRSQQEAVQQGRSPRSHLRVRQAGAQRLPREVQQRRQRRCRDFKFRSKFVVKTQNFSLV